MIILYKKRKTRTKTYLHYIQMMRSWERKTKSVLAYSTTVFEIVLFLTSDLFLLSVSQFSSPNTLLPRICLKKHTRIPQILINANSTLQSPSWTMPPVGTMYWMWDNSGKIMYHLSLSFSNPCVLRLKHRKHSHYCMSCTGTGLPRGVPKNRQRW